MAGSPAFDSPQRTEIDLVVLFFGADLKSEANMVSDKLPAMASWCSEQGLHLQVHSRWPEDTAQHDERPGDFAETPVGKLRDLVTDKDVFVFAIIGPDMPDADVALLKFVRNARPGYDRRVRYVFLPRPGGDAEAVRSLFADLWREAQPYSYRELTAFRLEEDLVRWLGGVLGLSIARNSGSITIEADSGSTRRIEGDSGSITTSIDLEWWQQEPQSAGPDPDQDRTPATVVDENVQFTVYRPNAVQPEVWYPLLAFAHLAERRPDAPPGQPDPLEQVRALATQVLGDEAAYSAPRVDARGGVPREGQLTFAPLVEGVDFNPRTLTFEWQEDVHQQNFRLKARPATAGRVLRGRLTVYLGAFILADVDLTFRVDFAAPPPPTPTVRPVTPLATSSAPPMSLELELTPVTAVPYQKVFPSYSHKDLAIVHQAEAYGKALGHVYLRDRLALRSGEDWEQRLLELIDEADIFQLFWSSNSMRSEYVRREWEHALALGRREFIRPTYWEVPMPHSANPLLPPDELAKLHFHGFFEESDGTSGSPRSKSGGRRRVARILTAAAAVATILAVPALTLWPGMAPPVGAPPPTSSASGPTPKPPLTALPRSTPLTDTQLLVPVLVDGTYDIYLGDVTRNAPVRALIKRPGNYTAVTLSPDRASMIYLHDEVLQVAAADGTGSRPLFSRVPKQCATSTTRPGWNSADPTQLAIACVDADGKAGVYLVTIDGKVIRKLSEGDDRVGDPGFSPDGKFVVFWANTEVLGDPGFDGGAIVVASTNGRGKPRRVTRMTNTVFDADPAWSPRGDQLAFRRDRTGDRKKSDIYVIDAYSKSEAKPLADDPHADEQNPAWSPSGDQIAYQSNAKTPAWPGPPLARVWVMDSNGNNQQVLWASGRAALGAQIAPSWSSR